MKLCPPPPPTSETEFPPLTTGIFKTSIKTQCPDFWSYSCLHKYKKIQDCLWHYSFQWSEFLSQTRLCPTRFHEPLKKHSTSFSVKINPTASSLSCCPYVQVTAQGRLWQPPYDSCLITEHSYGGKVC